MKRLNSGLEPIDYFWLTISTVCLLAVPVIAYIRGDLWVLAAAGAMFGGFYFLARVETGVWIDEADSFPGKYRPYTETDPRNAID